MSIRGSFKKIGKNQWLILILAMAATAGYVVAAYVKNHVGFPLDDAWIHQTYARNLAQHGEWAFMPGKPSAGSTAPLWSVLLAVGYLLKGIPFAWTFLLGGLSLAGVALSGEWLFRVLSPQYTSRLPLAGFLLATEWHLVWAAGSGMETALQAALVMACFALMNSASFRQNSWLFGVCGLLCGVSLWVRPDGLTLIGPVVFCAVFLTKTWKTRLVSSFMAAGGLLVAALPYLWFNFQLAGSFWPNTFYAKQAEYASQVNIPLSERLSSILGLPLIGVGLLLLPGVFYFIWKAGRERRYFWISMFLWWTGYSLIYVFKLPVVYQHGRYLMPAMPVFWLMGMMGTVYGLGALALVHKWRRRVTLFFVVLALGVNLSFYGLGATTYSTDVAIIESEMVASAVWIEENTEPDALIAAHDIGALGYFGNRDLVDLAGLISPEVIPFIRDEEQIKNYLNEVNAGYLMTFPGWYPKLIESGRLLFTTHAEFSPSEGGENMAVYTWEGD